MLYAFGGNATFSVGWAPLFIIMLYNSVGIEMQTRYQRRAQCAKQIAVFHWRNDVANQYPTQK